MSILRPVSAQTLTPSATPGPPPACSAGSAPKSPDTPGTPPTAYSARRHPCPPHHRSCPTPATVVPIGGVGQAHEASVETLRHGDGAAFGGDIAPPFAGV